MEKMGFQLFRGEAMQHFKVFSLMDVGQITKV